MVGISRMNSHLTGGLAKHNGKYYVFNDHGDVMGRYCTYLRKDGVWYLSCTDENYYDSVEEAKAILSEQGVTDVRVFGQQKE